MKNLSKEIKIGIMVVGAIIVMFVGFRIMRDVPIFRTSHQIYSVFPKVTGLNVGNQILVRGVKVGSVKEVQLTDEDSVKVVMAIEEAYNIPKGSTAEVEAMDFLGTKAIVINRGEGVESVGYNERIKGIYEKPVMEKFEENSGDLASSVSNSVTEFEQLLTQLNKVLSDKNTKKVDSIITNFQGSSEKITDLINKKQNEISNSITLIEDILKNVDDMSKENRQKIDSIMVNLQSSSERLNKLSGTLQITMSKVDAIVTKLDDGEGTLGLMINNPSVYNNIDSLTYNLSELVKKMNDDPRHFLKHMKIVDMF